MSPSDFRIQKMHKNEARKLIARLVAAGKFRFHSHAIKRQEQRDISSQDMLNVLESPSSFMFGEPEFENGSWRYRLCTNRFMLVIGFDDDGSCLTVITVMRRES